MSNTISGALGLERIANEVLADKKSTVLDGFVQMDDKTIKVVIQLTDEHPEGDLSPVYQLDQAEPLNFVLMPYSELTKEDPEIEVEPTSFEEHAAQVDEGLIDVVPEDDCNA